MTVSVPCKVWDVDGHIEFEYVEVRVSKITSDNSNWLMLIDCRDKLFKFIFKTKKKREHFLDFGIHRTRIHCKKEDKDIKQFIRTCKVGRKNFRFLR